MAHSSFEQEFHPLRLLREFAGTTPPAAPSPPNGPAPLEARPLEAQAPGPLSATEPPPPRPGCKLAKIHSISIYDHETVPEITCVRVTGMASKQRGNVPRALYVAQGANVLHLQLGSHVRRGASRPRQPGPWPVPSSPPSTHPLPSPSHPAPANQRLPLCASHAARLSPCAPPLCMAGCRAVAPA